MMINAYLRNPVTIIRTTLDEFGEVATTSRISKMGYVEWASKLVRNLQGELVTSAGNVLLKYDALVTHADKLEIDGVSHSIIRIEYLKDFATRAMRVYIQ